MDTKNIFFIIFFTQTPIINVKFMKYCCELMLLGLAIKREIIILIIYITYFT